jgi:GRAM domain
MHYGSGREQPPGASVRHMGHPMKSELRQGERIVKKGAASLETAFDTAGGKLYLTSHRLVFEAHMFNFRRGTTVVDLADIQSLRTAWTKWSGFIPFPNVLSILTRQGTEYRFLLFARNRWFAAIETQGRVARVLQRKGVT